MLVLTRKERQIVYVGDVKIVFLRTRKSHVSVGIEAPHGVKVLRGELRGLPQNAEASGDEASGVASVEAEALAPAGA